MADQISCFSMPREIVTIHVGGAGVRLGGAWWPLLFEEHALPPLARLDKGQGQGRQDKEVTSPLMTLFNLSQGGHYKPRALLVDTGPEAVGK